MKKLLLTALCFLTCSLVWAGDVVVRGGGTTGDGNSISTEGTGSNPAEALSDANRNLNRGAIRSGGVESVTPEDTRIIRDSRGSGD